MERPAQLSPTAAPAVLTVELFGHGVEPGLATVTLKSDGEMTIQARDNEALAGLLDAWRDDPSALVDFIWDELKRAPAN